MSVVLFVLGRPGSGKTTAVQRIIELAVQKGYSTYRAKDYEILYEMFLADTEHKKFYPTKYDGFDVHDFTVLNEALEKLELNIRQRLASKKSELIIVEFARNDYPNAFQCFSQKFLKESYFFFVEANLDICVQRIHERISFPIKPDHHYVSDEIVRTYYSRDNYSYMTHDFNKNYRINKEIKVFDNSGSREDFIEAVNEFAEIIFKREEHILRFVKDDSSSAAALPASFGQGTYVLPDATVYPLGQYPVLTPELADAILNGV